MTADEFKINLTDREIGACRCAYVEAMRLNRTLIRLCGWSRVAGHKAIVRRYQRLMHLAGRAASI